jgi:arsenate reductase
MKNVMFVCQDNTYSQIAEAWMRSFVSDGIFVASSGLSNNQSRATSAELVNVMNEVGIDISDHQSKLLSDYRPENFDAVISLCDFSMRIPDNWMLSRIFDEWMLPQLEVNSSDSCRHVRDDIRDKVDLLLMRYA